MLVQFTKRTDGSGVLRCVRDDGSTAWQKQNDRVAAYFALHDLTHFAVESTLGYKRGFFGLIAEGWEFDDTTGKGAHGALPAEAAEVEGLVGMFFAEMASRTIWSAEDFNSSIATYFAQGGMAVAARRLTEEELAAVRSRRNELFREWENVAAGKMLELKFPV